MTLANFFRAITNAALTDETFLGFGHFVLSRTAPTIGCAEYQTPEYQFQRGFEDGFNYEAGHGDRSSAAYQNGLVLGLRLRQFRRAHGLEDQFGLPYEHRRGETLYALAA